MCWRTCLAAAGLALLFVAGCDGIWCFQCNSREDENCTSIEPNNTMSVYYKECDQDFGKYQPFCRKIVQKIHDRDGLVRVVRKCGWLKHPRLDCYRVSNVGHAEQVCQCFTDACNRATSSDQLKSIAMSILLACVLIAR